MNSAVAADKAEVRWILRPGGNLTHRISSYLIEGH